MTTEVSADVDLAGYFDRVGYPGPVEATVETLHALVAAHNRSIPFENLDPLMGIPVDDLSPAAVTDKLVNRRRGGYCYEQNGLMGYVLAELGFGVERLAGRVVWMNPNPELPAQASGSAKRIADVLMLRAVAGVQAFPASNAAAGLVSHDVQRLTTNDPSQMPGATRAPPMRTPAKARPEAGQSAVA